MRIHSRRHDSLVGLPRFTLSAQDHSFARNNITILWKHSLTRQIPDTYPGGCITEQFAFVPC